MPFPPSPVALRLGATVGTAALAASAFFLASPVVDCETVIRVPASG